MAEIIEKIDIKDFPSLSAIDKRDNVLLSRPGALGGAKISFELLLAMVAKDVKPIIKDGSWYIGGLDTGVDAVGKTPIFRTTSVGIEYQYEGDIAWMSLVSYEVLKLKFADLTPEQQELLKGEKGDAGIGIQGVKGDTGKSAYQIAKENGYKDTEAQFGIEQSAIAGNSARLTAVETNKQDKPIAGRTFLTPLFVARGAVFNDKTGFYELNGLLDITEAQMMTIYNESSACFSLPNLGELYARTNMRTNLLSNQAAIGGNIIPNIDYSGLFSKCDYIEIIKFNGSLYPAKAHRMFDNCLKLKSIIHTASSSSIALPYLSQATLMFNKCIELENIKISSLGVSITFSDSPNLSYESVMYIINNAANKTPITLTLHSTAKARLTEEDIALAVSKNITIA